MQYPMATLRPELRENADEGIRLCRNGDWNKGLPVLASVLESRWPGEEAPGVIYAYLGYGVARYQNKLRDGLKLCEHAVKQQFYEAENHFHLARVQMLAGDRKAALAALDVGLKLDPDHPGLVALKKEFGVRRRPIVGFLDRDHPLNVLLGRLRHTWSDGK
jgi:tetratricopeptide (TPR) repeat protein